MVVPRLSHLKHFTSSVPLLTPNHCFMTCGGTKTSTSTTLYRQCALTYPNHCFMTCGGTKTSTSTTFYRQCALTYPNHCFMTCGGTKTLTSTTFYRQCALTYQQPQFEDMWWYQDFHLYHIFFEMCWKSSSGGGRKAAP